MLHSQSRFLRAAAHVLTLNMPIGGYSIADGICPTCGLADENSYLGEMDTPLVFYLSNRFGAQLIWFQQGFLEYRFSSFGIDFQDVDWIELSFEACSEAPMYRLLGQPRRLRRLAWLAYSTMVE